MIDNVGRPCVPPIQVMLPCDSDVDFLLEVGPCCFDYRVSLAVVDEYDGQAGFVVCGRRVVGGMEDVEGEDIQSVPFFDDQRRWVAVTSGNTEGRACGSDDLVG